MFGMFDRFLASIRGSRSQGAELSQTEELRQWAAEVFQIDLMSGILTEAQEGRVLSVWPRLIDDFGEAVTALDESLEGGGVQIFDAALESGDWIGEVRWLLEKYQRAADLSEHLSKGFAVARSCGLGSDWTLPNQTLPSMEGANVLQSSNLRLVLTEAAMQGPDGMGVVRQLQKFLKIPDLFGPG